MISSKQADKIVSILLNKGIYGSNLSELAQITSYRPEELV